MIASIIALDRRELPGLVAIEILLRDDSAARPARFDDGRSRLASIEAVNALPSDRTQRACEVTLQQPLAGDKGQYLVEEDFGGRWKFFEDNRPLPVLHSPLKQNNQTANLGRRTETTVHDSCG